MQTNELYLFAYSFIVPNFVSDTNNLISIIYLQLDIFKYSKWLYISFWPIDGNLSCTISFGQSGPRNNDNEGVQHIALIFRTEAAPSDV